MSRIVVAGGGIAGLSIAYALRTRDPQADVVVLERAPRTGGNIRTERIDGYTCEWGPDGFLDNAPETLRLVGSLGLEDQLLRSNDAARRRFIVRRGRLIEVPASPSALVTSGVLSARAKLRLALEPFAAARNDDDESIHEFATRRIGVEPAETLVGAMVSGIYAGDARALSLRACFPKMRQLEDDHGGLIRAMLARARTRSRGAIGAPAGSLTSFAGGMGELIDGLTRALESRVRTSTPVLGLLRIEPAGRYAVVTRDGTIEADAIVLAGPASESASVLDACDPVLADLLRGIPAAPLAVVCLGYPETALEGACDLKGFGFLVPRTEPFRILGALWESSIYASRAPAGHVLMRVMIGGACDPDAVRLADDRLLEIVRRDLAALMGISATPEFVRIIRHLRGIPQYVKGHLARLDDVGARLRAFPGVFLAGNSYRGVSINSCVGEAETIAAAALEHAAALKAGGRGRPAPLEVRSPQPLPALPDRSARSGRPASIA